MQARLGGILVVVYFVPLRRDRACPAHCPAHCPRDYLLFETSYRRGYCRVYCLQFAQLLC